MTNRAEEIKTKPGEFTNVDRLAYISEAPVWWCEELGTVLANEEVIDGKSEVGGFPVTRRPMRQWDAPHHRLRRAVAGRASIKLIGANRSRQMQRNWIWPQ